MGMAVDDGGTEFCALAAEPQAVTAKTSSMGRVERKMVKPFFMINLHFCSRSN
jgi:hypothetical protein